MPASFKSFRYTLTVLAMTRSWSKSAVAWRVAAAPIEARRSVMPWRSIHLPAIRSRALIAGIALVVGATLAER